MHRQSYRAASFLDDRLLQGAVDAHVVAWPEIEGAVPSDARKDARWIFHIGHVGSTLVSRLLGELERVLAIREPRLLRDLAVSPSEVRKPYVELISKLMSRTFATDEIACVKATSFASEIAPLVVPSRERALFMFASPRNYVASILAGENSVIELRNLAQFRERRLASRGIAMPSTRNDADRAAVAWACEMATLEAAAEAMPDRHIAWMNFDRMLMNMASELGRIASFFGFTADPGRMDAIAHGPLLHRYSKDPSYEYSARLREDLIAQEMHLQKDGIEAALAMLREAAEKAPLLQRALKRSAADH
jgi:hypothetical protein